MADDETPISPVVENRPELTITSSMVNNEPVELDSTPTSAERIREIQRGSMHEQMSPAEKEKRQKLISERKEDKGVLVDISTGNPTAEEFEKTEDAAESSSNKA